MFLTGGPRARRRHEGAISSLAWSRDGTRLVTGGADKAIRFWEPPKTECTRSLPVGHEVDTVAWSPDGAYVTTILRDGKIRVSNANTGDTRGNRSRVPNPAVESPTCSACSPSGRYVALGYPDGSVQLHRAPNPP
ncbi:MAG: hypothetical protein AAF550_13920 [Myxococcota bacterium]